jgi:hypothetical protein
MDILIYRFVLVDHSLITTFKNKYGESDLILLGSILTLGR